LLITKGNQNYRIHQLAQELGSTVIFCPGDVTSVQDAERAVAIAVQTFGSLQVLVNCAGIAISEPIYDADNDQAHSLENFQRVINVNLNGSFNMMSQAAKAMAKNDENSSIDLTDPMMPDIKIIQKGVIINTASCAAYDGQINQAAYSASKSALVGLTLPAARDLASVGIRVNTIAPGVYRTPMVTKYFDGLPNW